MGAVSLLVTVCPLPRVRREFIGIAKCLSPGGSDCTIWRDHSAACGGNRNDCAEERDESFAKASRAEPSNIPETNQQPSFFIGDRSDDFG